MTIFGYTWDEIKLAQQGGALARRIPAGICKPLATEGDWELLERYGEAELRNRHYFGVLDRLENTRMLAQWDYEMHGDRARYIEAAHGIKGKDAGNAE